MIYPLLKDTSLIEKTLKHAVTITTPNCPPELAEFNESTLSIQDDWKKHRPQSSQNKPYSFDLPFLTYSQDLNNLWYVPRVLKALNKPAVTSHLGPITSAHQGPVFLGKNIPYYSQHQLVLLLIASHFGWCFTSTPPSSMASSNSNGGLGIFWAQGDFLPTGCGLNSIWRKPVYMRILTTLWFGRFWGSK